MKDQHSHIKVVQLIKPIVVNNDSEGTPASGVDLQGYSSCDLVALLGVSGDTLAASPEVSIKVVVEDSDDNSTWAAVTDADAVLVGSNAAAAAPDGNGVVCTVDAASEDEVVVRVGYRGTKRYARLRLDMTGTHTNGTPAAVFAILGSPHIGPTSD